MGGLEFSFAEMLRELSDFSQEAVGFLDPSAEGSLGQLKSGLENIQLSASLSGAGEPLPWEIPDVNPLKTKPSRAYERGEREGGPEVIAQITSIWQVRPGRRPNNRTLPKTFRVAGKASVRVDWWRVDGGEPAEPVGMWRMELADAASPGCFFHIQIQGEDGRMEAPFPHAIPVPRLPCIAFTPMAVLEFVLGELFQDEWERHSLRKSPNLESWRASQQKRLTSLLTWQQSVVKNAPGPPWTALKLARPSNNLFMPS